MISKCWLRYAKTRAKQRRKKPWIKTEGMGTVSCFLSQQLVSGAPFFLDFYVGFKGCRVILNDLIFPKYRRSYNDITFTGSCAGHHPYMLRLDVSLHRKTLASQTSESD